MKYLVLVLVTALVSLSGCQQEVPTAATGDALSTPVPAGMVRGTVLETMNSGGYTYISLDTGDSTRWLAVQQMPVQVGDVLLTDEGMPMTGFTSKTLNRTFDVIYFVGSVKNLSSPTESQAAGGLPEGHPPIADAPAVTPDASDAPVTAVTPGENIGWLYDNKATLAGTSVTLRGKVVKYNAGILGWNFIHLQDGSGDAAAGTNDLTVTSRDVAAVGQIVTVTGKIVLDKDFGAGYTFPVLMDDAAVTAE